MISYFSFFFFFFLLINFLTRDLHNMTTVHLEDSQNKATSSFVILFLFLWIIL